MRGKRWPQAFHVDERVLAPERLCLSVRDDMDAAVMELLRGKPLEKDDDGDIYSADRWAHVEIVLRVLQANLVEISHIETEPANRRRGLGTAALGEVCAWADKFAIVLCLHARRSSIAGGDSPYDEELEAWYQRFGFALAGDGYMRRAPDSSRASI